MFIQTDGVTDNVRLGEMSAVKGMCLKVSLGSILSL